MLNQSIKVCPVEEEVGNYYDMQLVIPTQAATTYADNTFPSATACFRQTSIQTFTPALYIGILSLKKSKHRHQPF